MLQILSRKGLGTGARFITPVVAPSEDTVTRELSVVFRCMRLFMIKLFCLVFGLAGQVYPKLAERGLIHLGKDDVRMRLAVAQLRKLPQRQFGRWVGSRADG